MKKDMIPKKKIVHSENHYLKAAMKNYPKSGFKNNTMLRSAKSK